MASNLSFKITGDSQDFSKAMEEVKSQTGSVKKQMRQMTQEVTNLEHAYRNLSDEEKSSPFGKYLRQEIDKSISKLAELKDVSGDVQNNINKMASDTQLWDAMSETIGIGADAVSAFAASMGIATKEGTLAADAINALARAQTISNLAIKVGNALQKDSKIMSAITTIQLKAQTAATNLQTKSTVGATVAQKAFNAVAKANPYVLLATAIIGVVGAIGALSMASNKAKDDVRDLNKELHDASIQGQKDAQNDITKLNLLYNAATDETRSKEERIKASQKLLDQYPVYFSNMTTEEIMLGKASKAYQQLKDDIIAVAKAKAYEQKITDLASEGVDIEDEIDKQEKLVKTLEKSAAEAKSAINSNTYGTANVNLSAEVYSKINSQLQKAKEHLEELKNKQEENNKAQEKYADKIKESSKAINTLEENSDKVKENNKPTKTPKTPKEKPEKAKEELTRLEELQKKVREAEKELGNIDISLPAADELISQAKDNLDRAKGELQNYKIKVGLEIDPKLIEKEKAQEEYNKIMESLNKESGPEFDFSALAKQDPEMAKAAEETVAQLEKVSEAKRKLNEIMNAPGSTDSQISMAQKGLEELGEKYDRLTEKANTYQEASNGAEEMQKHVENTQKAMGKLSSIGSSVGDMFSSLGQATDNEDLQIAGIIAQAIAKVAQGYAAATAQAASMGPWAWIAFAIAGAATMASTIAQIKNMTAGSYAEGGVISGGSSIGDHLLARVNSGEVILNKRQQESALALMNGGFGVNQVNVSGLIRGKDILLVTKNEIMTQRRQGKNIAF